MFFHFPKQVWYWCAALTVALCVQACAALPLATQRDATILAPGQTSVDTSYVPFSTLLGSNFLPSSFAGAGSVDLSFRQGRPATSETAVRAGLLATAPLGFQGFYGGYEWARSIRKGTRDWGTVMYSGAIAGADLLFGGYAPGHPFGQAYGGIVAGKVTGRFRPQLNVKGTLQGGGLRDDWAYSPYGVLAVTAEPRMNFVFARTQFYFALGLNGGVAVCERCAAKQKHPVFPVVGLYPAFGLAYQ